MFRDFVQNAPRAGTLMIRLSMAHTPATREATSSALARKFPLLDAPISVTVPLAADTVMPAGASPMLISSLSAALTLVASSLLASAVPIYAVDHRISGAMEIIIKSAGDQPPS